MKEKKIIKTLEKIVEDKKIILDHIRTGKPVSDLKKRGIKIVSPI